MHPNQKIKFKDWYMKIDPPIWITADFECMNVPLESANENDCKEKLFVNKPIAIGYTIFKKILIMRT